MVFDPIENQQPSSPTTPDAPKSKQGSFGQPRSMTSGRFSRKPSQLTDSLLMVSDPARVIRQRMSEIVQRSAPQIVDLFELLTNGGGRGSR